MNYLMIPANQTRTLMNRIVIIATWRRSRTVRIARLFLGFAGIVRSLRAVSFGFVGMSEAGPGIFFKKSIWKFFGNFFAGPCSKFFKRDRDRD